ncbi:hypothetical protein BC941DRAFT_448342 [Chlamydoabsidia padenii]|nr:hypothetical protein BC941DRAFT_448342 [Chlamydoabsidia padenii]
MKKHSVGFALFFFFSLFFTATGAATCNKTHTVAAGESCRSIAADANISSGDFLAWNPSLKKTNCHGLHVGQTVCIGISNHHSSPTKTTPTETTKKAKKPKPTSEPTYLPGLTLAVTDETQFCLLLPSSPGNRDNHNGTIDPDAIASSEKNATVFCTMEDMAPGAQLMPEDFITLAEYQYNTTAEFVQVRGKIDREKYDLSKSDGGGQYDNHGQGSPPLSMCLGYRYYVSLIEPDIQGFCIRCCQSYQDCNASRSEYGCKRVIPALDYSI